MGLCLKIIDWYMVQWSLPGNQCPTDCKRQRLEFYDKLPLALRPILGSYRFLWLNFVSADALIPITHAVWPLCVALLFCVVGVEVNLRVALPSHIFIFVLPGATSGKLLCLVPRGSIVPW